MAEQSFADMTGKIATNLPDNTAREITPAKHREVTTNLLDSLFLPHCHMVLTDQGVSDGTVVIGVGDIGTFKRPTGPTSILAGAKNFQKNADFSLIYKGTISRPTVPIISFTVTSDAGGNTMLKATIAKNGTPLPKATMNEVEATVKSGEPAALTLVGDFPLVFNDVVDFVLTADKAATLTISSLNFNIGGLYA